MENKSWFFVENWYIDDWIWNIISTEDSLTVCLILTCLWIIWYNRNLAVHGKTILAINMCSFKTKQYIQQHDRRNVSGINFLQPGLLNGDHTMNFFTDGSWSTVTKEGGWAAIAVTNNNIFRCQVDFSNNSKFVFEAELLGILTAFRMASEMDLCVANFFCDSTDVI